MSQDLTENAMRGRKTVTLNDKLSHPVPLKHGANASLICGYISTPLCEKRQQHMKEELNFSYDSVWERTFRKSHQIIHRCLLTSAQTFCQHVSVVYSQFTDVCKAGETGATRTRCSRCFQIVATWVQKQRFHLMIGANNFIKQKVRITGKKYISINFLPSRCYFPRLGVPQKNELAQGQKVSLSTSTEW